MHSRVLAALALIGALLVVAPGSAAAGDSLFEDDTPLIGTGASEDSTPVDSSDSDEAPDTEGPSALEELAPEGPPGPVGFADGPVYDTVRGIGEIIPSEITVVRPGESVEVITRASEEGDAFQALLVIEGSEAPTEYRFEKAVPEGHTAELQEDGWIRFVDEEGENAGGIAPPWALDADGVEIRTSFALDGDALIQTVEHEGAAYPVVADPFWVVVLYATIYVFPVVVVYSQCASFSCGPAIATAVTNVPTSGSGGGDGRGRPTNTCNGRNRVGC